MRTLLNLLGNVVNSILLLITVILIADIIIQNAIKKSGKLISEIPAGPIVNDTVKTILPFVKKAVKIEDEELLKKVTVAIAIVIIILIKVIIIR